MNLSRIVDRIGCEEVGYVTTLKDKEKAKVWIKKQSQYVKMHTDENQKEELIAFLKHLSNVVERLQPQNKLTSSMKQEDQLSKKDLSFWFEELCERVLMAGEANTFTKEYKTSDIAKFMGVTVATVNNWIKENRIRGFIKENKYAHARIPETAIYLTQSNETMTIKEIAELYQTEKEKHAIQTPKEDEMLESIKYFNQKYCGTYFETLAKKASLTSEEQRDVVEWKYVLKRLDLYHEKK